MNNYSQKYREDHEDRHPPHREQDYEDRMLPKYKIQETRTLMVQLNDNGLKSIIERTFTDLSITVGTSVPDDVEVRANATYIKYPSVEAAKSICQYLKGDIQIQDKKYKINYYPIRKVDITLAYDWYCQKCDYKNFSRRNICYRCQATKSNSCRLSYSTLPSGKIYRQETPDNCSLMLRGSVLMEIEENVLLQAFQQFVPVRDIRQIKNKLTGKWKDFAFIQFYTPQETTKAYRQATSNDFRIYGSKITVLYSRNKSDEDQYKPLPYENNKKDKKHKQKSSVEDNYYHRQRQRQIQEQKAKPLITMEQLKEKKQQEMKKIMQAAPKEMNEEQAKRKQAEMLAKQWQRQMKTQITMYICPICNRKFNNMQQMRVHERMSKLHQYNMQKIKDLQIKS